MPPNRLRILLFLTFMFAASCTPETAPSPDTSPDSSASPSAAPIESANPEESPAASPRRAGNQLLYLEGKLLRLLNVESGSSETLEKLPSADAVASSDGSLVAYVTSAAPSPGEEDFVAQPVLHIYEVASGRDITVGSGFSPLWNSGGDRLAYLEPREARVCEGETCEGTNSLAVAQISTNERSTILDAGVFALLGWLGERVVVSQQGTKPTSATISESGDVEKLPVEPSEFWGTSPDGSWIVRSVMGRIDFIATDGSDRVTVSNPGSVLGEGAWSPDSGSLIAVSIKARGNAVTRLVRIDQRSGETAMVPESTNASGPVLWAPDGSAFAYVREVGGKGLDLQAVVCEPPADMTSARSCRTPLSWPRGVTLLALT